MTKPTTRATPAAGALTGQQIPTNARAVLITGAANGIGAACAERFLAEGWHVIGWDRQPGSNELVHWRQLDVTDWDAVSLAASELPPLGAALNCAGTATRTPAIETSQADWDRVIAVNLSAPFYVARLVFPALEHGHGVLVNIASINATNTFSNRAAYNCTKAALLSLTQTLAVEWAAHGVRVVAVSPGFTETEMLQQGIREGRTPAETILAYTPQRRLLKPAEIAAAIVRLVGPDFAGLTGSNVLIDGGFDAWGGRF